MSECMGMVGDWICLNIWEWWGVETGYVRMCGEVGDWMSECMGMVGRWETGYVRIYGNGGELRLDMSECMCMVGEVGDWIW